MKDEQLENELNEHYETDLINYIKLTHDRVEYPVIDYLIEDHLLEEDKENRLINLEFDSLVFRG